MNKRPKKHKRKSNLASTPIPTIPTSGLITIKDCEKPHTNFFVNGSPVTNVQEMTLYQDYGNWKMELTLLFRPTQVNEKFELKGSDVYLQLGEPHKNVRLTRTQLAKLIADNLEGMDALQLAAETGLGK